MRRFLPPLAVILGVAFFLAPFLQDFFRELLVIPFLYLFWIGRFLFEAVPQSALWSACFSIFIIILSLSLFQSQRRRRRGVSTDSPPEGRVEGWIRIIELAQRDSYFKWRLAQQFQKILLNIVAHQKGQSIKQTRSQLRQGALGLPPELQAYFLASLQSLGHLPSPRRFFQTTAAAPTPLDLDPAYVTHYLDQLRGNDSELPAIDWTPNDAQIQNKDE